MVAGMRLSVVFIGHECVAGLVRVLDEVTGAVEKELGPSAVYLKSEAAPHSPEKNCTGLAGVESEELKVVRSQLRGNEACDAMDPVGHLPEGPRYEAHDSFRVVGVERSRLVRLCRVACRALHRGAWSSYGIAS